MFAAIDIGTNSVLLLIAEVGTDGSLRVIEDRATVTRLGEGLGETGAIADAAAERTLDCLCRYWELCVRHGVQKVAAVGTAALRSAANAADFLLFVKKSLGLEIEVLSAEREAGLTYRSCARDFGDDIVVVDIGGGSTEMTTTPHPPSPLRGEERVSFPSPRGGEPCLPAGRGQGEGVIPTLVTTSLPAGCVSLTEQFLKADPPTEEAIAALRNHIRELLDRELDPSILSRPHDRQLIATAGTATTLAAMRARLTAYDPARVHGQRLSVDDLRDLIDAMRVLPVEERKRMPGLLPERADVILAGAELLQALMSFLGYASVTVSDRGLRWGLLYEKFCPGAS